MQIIQIKPVTKDIIHDIGNVIGNIRYFRDRVVNNIGQIICDIGQQGSHIVEIQNIKIIENIPQYICNVGNFRTKGCDGVTQINKETINNVGDVAQINIDITQINNRIAQININDGITAITVAVAIIVLSVCSVLTVRPVIAGRAILGLAVCAIQTGKTADPIQAGIKTKPRSGRCESPGIR